MDKIGPVEAANTIRDEFLNEHIDPRFHHQVRFSGDVLAELGQEKSIENTAKVMRLLTKHGIEGHAYDDYPKWVTNERGERAVVNDEDHEASFMSRPESHVDGNPNPEHGHVDPQSGVFHAGMKPVVYDHSEFDAMEPFDKFSPEPQFTGSFSDTAPKVAAAKGVMANRAEQIKAEQERFATMEKAAKDERDRLDALQKQE